MNDRPNFLFIITDQQRADWLGCTGHPVVKTPNIDALADVGTLFDDFHVALPVCMPNRASLMTGRMPSVHGLRYNGCNLSLRANTFVDVLAAGGYRTACVGKSHLQTFTGLEPLQAADQIERPIPEAWKPEDGDYTQEEPSTYLDDRATGVRLPYYGFQHVDMVTGHGDKCGGHYGQWFRKTYPNWRELHDPKNQLAHNYTCPQAYRTPVPEQAYPTTWIGDRAVDYIHDAPNHAAPFFAFVSFPDPHHPFNPPGKYWDMYSPDQFDIPLPYDAHKNPPPPLQYLTEMWQNGQDQAIPQMAFRADDTHIKEAMALSAGMISMVDDQVGRLLDALKDTGQYDNTVIIFTSDHGDYLGAFHLLLKGPYQHHSITRVPFIWSDPTARVHRRIPALASTIDISASILDRVDLAPYWGMQGQSFLPTLNDGVAHRDELLIEHNDGGVRMGMTRPARVRSLRSKEWRLSIYMGEGWGELYHLISDPDETLNLWDDPDYAAIKAELTQNLVAQLTAQMDESPRAKRLA